jgi:hypothetical protein
MEKHNQQTILNSYLTCALWASSFYNDDTKVDVEFDTIYDITDFTDEFIKSAILDVHNFVNDCGNMLDAWDDTQIGHDFWLTRCGHGAGFWDRDLPYGNEISKLVGHGTKYPNIDLFITDDNKVDGE